MLYCHLLLGIPFLFSPILTTFAAHHILLDFTQLTTLSDLYKSLSPSLCNIPIFLDSCIFLRTLFSDTSNLWSSIKAGNHVSHPYSMPAKMAVVLHILIFSVLEIRRYDNSIARIYLTRFITDVNYLIL